MSASDATEPHLILDTGAAAVIASLVALDGFALRFPRVGIVNYIYNTAQELRRRPGLVTTLLLHDLHFSDPDVAALATGMRHRVLGQRSRTGLLGFWDRLHADRKLAAHLPAAHEVARGIRRSEVFHATDWYCHPIRRARGNVITYFDATTLRFPQFHEYTNIEKERRKAASLKGFDCVVAISEATRADLVDLLRVPPDRVRVCPLGADPAYDTRRYKDRDELLRRHGIDPARRYVLSVSTIEPRKNIIGVLEAFLHLQLSRPVFGDLLLVLCGPMGWQNDGLERYLRDYPIRHNVLMPGYVPLDDMPSLYHHAEASIYLSFHEGFGLPILEAMKSGCPVVCSDTSSMPEVVGPCGATVPPGSPEAASEALARIVDDPAHADMMRFAALQRARSFTWQRHVDALAALYDEL